MNRSKGSAALGKSKKRKLPTTFLDCRSLVQVSDFPFVNNNNNSDNDNDEESKRVVTSDVTSDSGKQIFLERLGKEIVKRFRPTKSTGQRFVMKDGSLKKASKDPKNKPETKDMGVWEHRIKIGSNQCLKVLEAGQHADHGQAPALIVLAKDIYPPTAVAHVPAIARHQKIPLLILPGKATSELGKVVGFRKAAIMLFLTSYKADAENEAMDSFIEFVISHIPRVNKPSS